MSAAPDGHCPLHEGVEMEPASSPIFVLRESLEWARDCAEREIDAAYWRFTRTHSAGVPPPVVAVPQAYVRRAAAVDALRRLPRAELRVCQSCSPTLRVGHLFVEPGTGRQEWR